MRGASSSRCSAVWPRPGRSWRARSGSRMPRIGFLVRYRLHSNGIAVAAFAKAFRLGWIEGRTAAIEIRWAEGDRELRRDACASLR